MCPLPPSSPPPLMLGQMLLKETKPIAKPRQIASASKGRMHLPSPSLLPKSHSPRPPNVQTLPMCALSPSPPAPIHLLLLQQGAKSPEYAVEELKEDIWRRSIDFPLISRRRRYRGRGLGPGLARM
jgi:hypothetical protein